MDVRRLAGTDLEVSSAALGTMTFGSQVDEHEAEAMFRRCLDRGINFFDTANSYNVGKSEQMLGELSKDVRDQIVIATKVGNKQYVNPEEAGLHPVAIRRAVTASLRRLRRDHIDLYYLHMPDRDVRIEESLGALAELRSQGLIRNVGISNYAAWQMEQVQALHRYADGPPVLVAQTMYNLLARRVEGEYADFVDHAGMSTVVYNPLAGGLLTGKHELADPPEDGTRFTSSLYRDRYWNQQQLDALRELRQIARDAGISLLQLALRWVAERPLTQVVLLGASSLPQLEANLDALGAPPLGPDLDEALDAVWRPLAGAAPDYYRT